MRNPYFLITCLVLAFNIYAIAQVTTANVLGRVTDTSGAVLPGVMVVVGNLGTGATRFVVSSAWNQLNRWGSRENSSGRILIATSRFSFVFS